MEVIGAVFIIMMRIFAPMRGVGSNKCAQEWFRYGTRLLCSKHKENA